MKLHKSIGSDTKNKQTHLTQKETRMHIFNLFHIYKQSNDLLSTHLFVTPIMLSRIKSIYFFGYFFCFRLTALLETMKLSLNYGNISLKVTQ